MVAMPIVSNTNAPLSSLRTDCPCGQWDIGPPCPVRALLFAQTAQTNPRAGSVNRAGVRRRVRYSERNPFGEPSTRGALAPQCPAPYQRGERRRIRDGEPGGTGTGDGGSLGERSTLRDRCGLGIHPPRDSGASGRHNQNRADQEPEKEASLTHGEYSEGVKDQSTRPPEYRIRPGAGPVLGKDSGAACPYRRTPGPLGRGSGTGDGRSGSGRILYLGRGSRVGTGE